MVSGECIRKVVFGGSSVPNLVAVGRLIEPTLLPVISVGRLCSHGRHLTCLIA